LLIFVFTCFVITVRIKSHARTGLCMLSVGGRQQADGGMLKTLQGGGELSAVELPVLKREKARLGDVPHLGGKRTGASLSRERRALLSAPKTTSNDSVCNIPTDAH
jgi:hypothetical protein